MAHGMLRRLLDERLGAPGRALLAWRTRGRAEALLARRRLTVPARALAARLSDRVQRGPFAGMHYPRRRGDIVHAAKLVGAYECELHEAVESLIARSPRLVVNIGSGDGYYVVGLARRLASANIVAVDPDPLAQRACADTARRNAVDARLSQLVRLDAAQLGALLDASLGASLGASNSASDAGALAVVDCEGVEDVLIDPVRAPALARTDLLIETHDFAAAGVTERLTTRLRPTHDVRIIAVAPRDVSTYPELASLEEGVARGLLDEFRHHPQSWLVCTARAARH